MNTISVRNKTIVITGALGLLGREYVDVLSEEGANVVITDIDGEACKKLQNEINKKYDGKSFGVEMDIIKPSSIEFTLEKTLERFGTVDALVNNAAINNPVGKDDFFYTPFEDITLKDWDDVMDVNLTGQFLCCQIFGKQMLKQGHGNIINISSTYGLVAPDQRMYKHFQKKDGRRFVKPIMYSVSKAAVVMLTRYLAAYWGDKQIRVNALVPGGVYNNHDPHFEMEYSNRTPLGRMADKKDYNGALLFLLSDSSSYMTGSCLVVDGGWTIW